MIFSTAPRLPSASDWKIALCSESHRQQRGAGLAHRAQHDLAGADQRLLVGQRDAFAAADRGQGRRQAGGAGDRRHGPVGVQRRRPRPPLPRRPRPARRCRPGRRAGRRSRTASAITARSALQGDGLLGQQPRRCGRRPAPGPGSGPGAPASNCTVWVPTLPVLPRTVTVRGADAFIATALLHVPASTPAVLRPAQRPAARPAGRASRHGRGSAGRNPSPRNGA